MPDKKEMEKQAFLAVCDELKSEILDDIRKVHHLDDEVVSWVDEMIDYNCKDGKLNRGISVIHCYQVLAPNKVLTSEQIRDASILGWCIEWLQAFFLVADDIMDASITRRGKPCWFRLSKVKNNAINDAFLLESFVFQVLKKHFRQHSNYIDFVELFHEVIYQTELGQLMDLISQPIDSPIDLQRFTKERHRNIVLFKTAYYTFYLSAASAMLLSGITNSKNYEITKEICLKIGEYFQIQDDYLDCYGEPEVIGKIGTDIQDNKCSWMVVTALNKSNPSQKALLKEHYGKHDEASIQKVKELYKTLDLSTVYANYEQSSYEEICGLIEKVDDMPKDVFHMLLEKIYKRSK